MNATNFEKMFLNLCSIGRNLYGNCAVVMDNASYHNTLVDKKDRIGYWSNIKVREMKDMWKKQEVPGSQGRQNEDLTKKDMMCIIRANLPDEPKLIINEIAEKHGHKIIKGYYLFSYIFVGLHKQKYCLNKCTRLA